MKIFIRYVYKKYRIVWQYCWNIYIIFQYSTYSTQRRLCKNSILVNWTYDDNNNKNNSSIIIKWISWWKHSQWLILKSNILAWDDVCLRRRKQLFPMEIGKGAYSRGSLFLSSTTVWFLIFDFWNLSFWRGISNLNKVILMLYHYNDNVLLLKMFQILGKYNIEFEWAPTFNERRVGAYSKGALIIKYFSSKGGTYSKNYGTDPKWGFKDHLKINNWD